MKTLPDDAFSTVPSEVLFYLLNQDGKTEFASYDEAAKAYKPGDVIMCRSEDSHD